MASIAYIADQHMIEYHRLNGSKTMNFWRPSNSKRFTDFHQGDYLFFLVKGTERPRTREKGILGYGHLQKAQTMTFRQMWNTFKEENGYSSEEELYEAIVKVSKDRKMPSKLNCLYLDHVVFFQSPVYLSEIGIQVSNRLESFLYLDKEDPQATAKLLNKAKESGMDMWTLVMNNEEAEENFFEEEEIRHTIFSIHKRLRLQMTDWERKKARKWLREHRTQHPEVNFIKGSKTEGYSYDCGVCTFVLPMVSTGALDNNTQAMVGHAYLIKQMLEEECPYNIKIQFKLLGDNDTSELEDRLND